MVKRYDTIVTYGNEYSGAEAIFTEDPDGEYVGLSDYLLLQAALREALINWSILAKYNDN